LWDACVLEIAGVSLGLAELSVIVGGGAAAVSLSTPQGREAFTQMMAEGLEWASEQVSNGLNLFAKKPDVAYGDYLAKKYGLDRAQRRALHDWITRQGLTREEIEKEAEEFARLLKKQQNNPNQNDDDEEEGENE
jgi:hypothetical protein